MKWMAVIELVVWVMLFVGGAIQIVLSLVRREPRFKDDPLPFLALGLALISIGKILHGTLGHDSFLTQMASILGGIAVIWGGRLLVKRKIEEEKPIELGLGLSKEATSRDKGSAEKR